MLANYQMSKTSQVIMLNGNVTVQSKLYLGRDYEFRMPIKFIRSTLLFYEDDKLESKAKDHISHY